MLNAAFGWPPISSVDLPAGGPAFPLSALGVRARAKLSDQLTLLLAMFDCNAAGPGVEDPQNLDPHGLNFRLRDSPLLMGELQYYYQFDPSRPGTLKLGAWMHTGEFSDPRFDTNGVALADPASNGMPAQHRGDFAPYVVLEQMLVPFDPKGEKGIAGFGRLQVTQSDRNTVDFCADGGINVSGFWPARPDDSISVGLSYARISSAARGWTVQPDVQYVVHPGGGASDPNSASGQRIPDALVLGMRMTLQWGVRDQNSQQWIARKATAKKRPARTGTCRAGLSDRRKGGRGAGADRNR